MDQAVKDLLTKLDTVTSRLERVEKQLAAGGGAAASAPAAAGAGGASSASVEGYQALIDEFITPLVALSEKIGGELTGQVKLVHEAVVAQKHFLAVAASSSKPDDATLAQLIAPTSKAMGEIGAIRDSKRTSKVFNNLSAISEGIGALGWVLVAPKPGPHVEETRNSAQFYTNKLLKDFKGNDQVQVDFANTWIEFLKALQAYIKQTHTTGLVWNAKGSPATAAAAAAAPAPSAGGPPPPPPPPTQAQLDGISSAPAPKKAADTGALFAQLNQGDGVTKGLKKVTNDMKTKNRPDAEKSSVVPAAALVPKGAAAAAAAKPAAKKPPRFELDGKKWIVENQDGAKLTISETETNQVVYIFNCNNSTIEIKGKVNSICVDTCKKTGLVFADCVATCDVVNVSSVEVQCTGFSPSFVIDKASGCQLYLSERCLTTEIVSAKSSEMNVMFPGATADDDMVEVAIPEQFKSYFKGRTLVTESMAHV